MDADSSMLDKQARMLAQGSKNIKRRIHSWVNIWLNVVVPRKTMKGKFWTSVEKLSVEILDSRKTKDYRSYIHQQAEAGTNHSR